MDGFVLNERAHLFPVWGSYILVFSVILVSILKYRNELVFTNIGKAFIKIPSSIPYTKQESGVFGWINWILLLNYFVLSSFGVYMLLLFKESQNFYLVLMPIAYYFLLLFSIILVGFVSGESEKLREYKLLLNSIFHASGLLLVPILIVWLINPNWSECIVKITFILLILLQLFRIVRGIYIVNKNKIVWYYIILYLCGLEIWPIIVGFLIFSPDFS